MALDVFRGVTMASMVIVNNPGTWSVMYWPLQHAPWHGWTPTDLIFPFFLVIVGVSLTLSRQTLQPSLWPIVRRTLVIVGLGLFLSGFPRYDLTQWRFPGVLQRIALCYLAAALVYRWTSRSSQRPAASNAGLSQGLTLAGIVSAILGVYWALLTWGGDLTPTGNVGATVDRWVFGSHLYRKGDWDPEGLVSSLPAVATTLIGVLCGMWLSSPVSLGHKIGRMAAAGAVLMALGQAWHVWLPINKNLWTSSYVALSGGAALLTLAACLYAIDLRGWRGWTHPFVVLGHNALMLFVISGLIARILILGSLQQPIFEQGFSWIGDPKLASLAYSLVFLGMMYALCAWLYKRGIFLRA